MADTASVAARKTGKLIAFPRRSLARRRAAELEFLPGALEIIDTPASPVGRLMMGVIVLLVIVAVTWACIGKLDIIAVANGRLIPAGNVKMIQPLEIGVVKRIAVTEGDNVRRGDVLVELDPTTTAADVGKIARDLMQARLDADRLSAQLADDESAFIAPPGADPQLVDAEGRQLRTELAQHRAKLDGIDQQIKAKTAERDETKANVQKIDATLPLLNEKVRMYKQLEEQKLTSKINLIEAERQSAAMLPSRDARPAPVCTFASTSSISAGVAIYTIGRQFSDTDRK
jgi:hemolysin D